jgi:hypothetical protein
LMMSDGWYYTHGNETRGPVSATELRGLAKIGALQPTDLIWPAASGLDDAVLAEAALSFPQTGDPAAPEAGAGRALTPAPDWLPSLTEAISSLPDQPAGSTPPEVWLEDIRRVESPPPPEVSAKEQC